MAKPGNAITNDFVISLYNGSAWNEWFNIENSTGEGNFLGGLTVADETLLGGISDQGVYDLQVSGDSYFGGDLRSDENRVQSLSGTSVTMNTNSGHKGAITLSGNTTLTITNLYDGGEGSIEITNGSTYTLNINGSTGYTTEQVMGGNSTIASNDHTTVVYWRNGSTLYYGFIYDN
jgi:hypothetical protein